MSKVMLRLRDLESRESATKEFPSVDDAIVWLGARPSMTEVLGVVFEGLSREENDKMRYAMRPLDEAEKARVAALDAEAEEERERKARAIVEENAANARAAREGAKTADPKRPMELRYRFDKTELEHTDPLDERPITEEAKKAVLEWVHERMEWVAGRGQTIGEAKVMVYAGEVPAKAERIVGGSFVPVTAPPKGQN